jgi:hypothetical protein
LAIREMIAAVNNAARVVANRAMCLPPNIVFQTGRNVF